MDLSTLHVYLSPSPLQLPLGAIPELTATVENTGADAVTILTWNSPLDPSAGALGIFSATNLEDGTVIHGDTIAFNRQLPPPLDAFVTIAPGEKADKTFKLPTLQISAKGSYKIKGKGSWMGVWKGDKESNTQKLQAQDSATQGEFETEEALVVFT